MSRGSCASAVPAASSSGSSAAAKIAIFLIKSVPLSGKPDRISVKRFG